MPGLFDLLSDPQVGMQLMANSGPSVGAPRGLLDGVPEVVQRQQKMAMAQQQRELEQQRRAQLVQGLQASPMFKGISPSLIDASPDFALKMAQSQQPKARKTLKAADGRNRYLDTGEPVFPEVEPRNNGLSITLPDGTVVNQGSFGRQDQKNMANRVTDAQDTAASGSQLKQTVQMLKDANKNVGYSGVGGNAVGAVFDAAEQFGIDAPGTPAGRAQMRSGGLDVALAQVQKTKGAISNAEMALFMSAAPGLQNTPQGNAALLEMIDAVADRQIQRAGEMEKWRQQYGTLDGFESSWGRYVEANPIIVDNGQGSIGLAAQPTNSQPEDPLGIR